MKLVPARIVKLTISAIFAVSFSLTNSAQSTDQNFPTAVATNEINGTIKARDIGDSRLTSYFYTFDGGQGDIFINSVTKNFNGDIDVFTDDGLRPLTKMIIYSDSGENETGRLIYLRKPERLILRVEGRSPNDDPATFRIKFAGSFIAAAEQRLPQNPTVAKRESDPGSGIRVNSVGTIVEVIPKAIPPAKPKVDVRETIAAAVDTANKIEPSIKESENLPKPPAEVVAKAPIPKTPKRPVRTPKPKEDKSKSEIPSPKPPTKQVEVPKSDATSTNKQVEGEPPDVKTVFKKKSEPKRAAAAPKSAKAKVNSVTPPTAIAPDPMASIRLVVQLKNGDVIERPMSEIKKFSVDKGVLTVIANDGSTVKYSILDVAKVTIE